MNSRGPVQRMAPIDENEWMTLDKSLPRLDRTVAERVCGRAYAARGRAIFERGEVIAASVDRLAGELMGIVVGSRPDPYVQVVQLKPENRFENWCSCPMEESCKHVAAILYHYVDHRDELLGLRKPSPSRRPLDRWLEELDGAVATAANEPPDEPVPGKPVLLYQLDGVRRERPATSRAGGTPQPDGHGDAAGLRLGVRRSRLLVRGGFGKESVSRFEYEAWLPDWCTSIDRDILRALDDAHDAMYRAARTVGEPGTLFVGRAGARLLECLVRSGRCFLGSDRSRPLGDGGPRALALRWTPEGEQDGPDARLALEATLEDVEAWHLIDTTPPWYLDRATPAAGPIDGAPPAAVLRTLLRAPTFDVAERRRVDEAIGTRLTAASFPSPFESGSRLVDEAPVPHLVLRSRTDSDDPRDFVATLRMAYGEDVLAYEGVDTERRPSVGDGDGRRSILRRLDDEVRREDELRETCPALVSAVRIVDAGGPGSEPGTGHGAAVADGLERGDFVVSPGPVGAVVLGWRDALDALPALEELGWSIETEPPFGLELERLDELDADVSDEGGGWFELALAMTHGGERFALLPLVVEWLRAGERERPLVVRAESGAWLEIPHEVFRPVADTLLELFDTLPEGETIRLPSRHALLLDELERRWREGGGGATWRGGEALFALAAKLRRFDGVRPATLPDTVNATLRPYQLEGVAWLGFLAEYGFGGILADDMGLGKTLQTLAHLACEHAEGRLDGAALVVAPTSLLGNWAREAARFVPHFRTVVWHGAARHAGGLDARDCDLVVTSYALALRDLERLVEQPFSRLVLDEAQTIKNARTPGLTSAVQVHADAEHRLCLSGTPVENNLEELWAQFDFLMPGFLGDRRPASRNAFPHPDREARATKTASKPF